MSRRSGVVVSFLLLVAVLGAPIGAPAQQIRITDTSWIQLNYLIEVWAQAERVAEAGAPDRTETDAFVNLSRFALRGQVMPGLKFFVATGGDRNFGSFEVWDAAVFLELDRKLVVDVGRVLLPFVRHSQQFSNDLQTHEFQRTAFLYPRGSTVRRRDEGVRVRGLLAGDRVDYRLAVTQGLDTEEGVPRLTGRVGWNAGRPEPGYVFPGSYLKGPAVLTAGLAFDVQPDVVQGGGSYRALGVDAFWSVPRGSNRVTGQTAVVHYRGLNGTGPEGQPVVVDRTGVGAVFDLGYLAGSVGPVVAVEWFRPEGAGAVRDQLLATNLGLNWWLRGGAASVKLTGGLRKERGVSAGDADPVVTLQLQTRLPLPGRQDKKS